MTEKMLTEKLAITDQERRAFEIINLRAKAEDGKNAGDYIQDAARGIAKSILNVIIDDVDAYVIASQATDQNVQVNMRLIRHEESVGDNLYKCWYDIVWDSTNLNLPETVMNMELHFGHVMGYASTYFSEELVGEVIDSVSQILGEAQVEKTKSKKVHFWKYEVA